MQGGYRSWWALLSGDRGRGEGFTHHEGHEEHSMAWGRNQKAGRHGEISSSHPTRFVLVLSPAGTVLVLVLESSPANLAGGPEYEHRFEYEYRRFAAEYEYEYDWHSCAPREAVRGKQHEGGR